MTTTTTSTATPVVAMGLDDTLHAVVQVTHEHGLPLTGVSVAPARVQVFADAVDLRWWARWLTDPAASECRCTVWAKDTDVALHICATREGIEWVVTDHVPRVPAGPVLAEFGIQLDTEHLAVPAAVATALVDAFASDAMTGGEDR